MGQRENGQEAPLTPQVPEPEAPALTAVAQPAQGNASEPPALPESPASPPTAPAREQERRKDELAQAPPAPSETRELAARSPRRVTLIARHSMTVRVTHWLNAAFLAVMLMSGLQIFNAHPALYWGVRSDFDRPLFALSAERGEDGALVGVTSLFGYRFETTGVLGASRYKDEIEARGFPAWITLPGARWLSMGRRWHFFFAWLFVLNGLAYLAYALIRRHLQRDLWPTKDELRHIGRTALDHLRLRLHKGKAAARYNVLQKLAYLAVTLILGPLVVLTGLAMSPTLNAGYPWLPEIFGGRQSARTIHFLCAAGFVAFFVIHIIMVFVTGALNNIRSMITGRYAIEESAEGHGG